MIDRYADKMRLGRTERYILAYQMKRTGEKVQQIGSALNVRKERARKLAVKGEAIAVRAIGERAQSSDPFDVWAETEATRDHEYSFSLDDE